MFSLKRYARTVIVGGGIMGCGLLYHLAKEGWVDSVLIEKGELTSGSTWHAAGQCPHSVSRLTLARIHDYGIQLYPSLEAETGQSVSWHKTGSLRIASNEAELDWIRSQIGLARYVGYPMELIGPEEIRELHPYYITNGILAAVHTPEDGHIDPAGLCQALAKGARQLGATIDRHNRVTDIRPLKSREWEVVSENGSVVCEHVVNAAGSYASQVGEWVGINVPMANVLHHYLVTDTVPDFEDRNIELPIVRDDWISGYIRQEQQSILIGIYEQEDATTVWNNGAPWAAENELFETNWDAIAPWLERAFDRMPILKDRQIKRVVRGAITHTPDGHMLLGPAAGHANFWMACGAQLGIAWSCGAGKYLSQLMVHGDCEVSLREFDPRRFGPFATRDYSIAKSKEDYEFRHRTPVPNEEHPAVRPVKTSPLYKTLKDHGAIHTQIFGWERPKWFVPRDRPYADLVGFRRVGWFEPVGEECRSVRERVGILDLTAFAKFEVRGHDAEKFLDRVIANRLPRREGGIKLTHMLTPMGMIETEVTVTRLDTTFFYLATSALAELRTYDWMQSCRRKGEDVRIENVSDRFGCLVVAGPLARKVLAQTTDANFCNDCFGWLTGRHINVFGVLCRALRVTYTGELGWELHVPMEHLGEVYHSLWNVGQQYGMANFGSHALNSLRMEKAYVGGNELTNDVSPIEANVMRFIAFDKGSFVGRQALLNRKNEPVRWKLVYLVVEVTDADCIGGEAVLAGDQPVGITTSGGYGYATKQSYAFAYVDPTMSEPGTMLDVMVLAERHVARVLGKPAWDPRNIRLRS